MIKLILIIVIYSGSTGVSTSQHEYLFFKDSLCQDARSYYEGKDFHDQMLPSVAPSYSVLKVSARCVAEDEDLVAKKKHKKEGKGDGYDSRTNPN